MDTRSRPTSRWRPIIIATVGALVASLVVILPTPTSALLGAGPETRHVPGGYPTIDAAIQASAAGDTIVLAPGIYRETVELDRAVTLTSSTAIPGVRPDIDTTVIDGGGAGAAVRVTSNANGTVLRGLTIRNADDGITATGLFDFVDGWIHDTTDGIDYEGGSGGLVRNSVMIKNDDDGIDLDYRAEVRIIDNVISANGDDGIEIRLQEFDGDSIEVLIADNLISGNGTRRESGDGIQFIDYPNTSKRTFRIERNIISDNASVGVGMMADRQTVQNYKGAPIDEQIMLVNNTIVDNRIGLTGGDRTLIVNNIIAGNDEAGMKRVRGESAASNNLLFNNGEDFIDAGVGETSAVFGDPGLGTDGSLSERSAAIDVGTARFSSGGTTVVDMPASSYHGSAPDAGAIESTGTVEPDPDPAGEYVGRINTGSDDAEEGLSTHEVDLSSSDLEMSRDIGTRNDNQIVGLRFTDVTIPRGSTITSASIQFTSDEKASSESRLTIRGQKSGDAATFTVKAGSISSRPTTTAMISWTPGPWMIKGMAADDQQTPDISSVIHEIVSQPDWEPGNALAIFISGSGRRVAESANGAPSAEPVLRITFTKASCS